MSKRLKLLIQKRTSLKGQMDDFADYLSGNSVDHAILKLRNKHLSEIFRAFMDYNDELLTLDSKDSHTAEFNAIIERYYVLTAQANKVLNDSARSEASTSSGILGNENLESLSGRVTEKRGKLPIIKLPTFDGSFEKWLSFKNSFRNIIDSRLDLTDIDKLHYLKSALTGEASGKIDIFTIDGVHYTEAWEVLSRAYEVKRLLIRQHLSAIVNFPPLDKESTKGLSKLADDTQQHVKVLKSLGVLLTPEIIVYLLETKLPRNTMKQWEKELDRDQVATPDELYEFILKTAVSASIEKPESENKRKSNLDLPARKRRTLTQNRAFMLNTPRTCAACDRAMHPLYKCEKFNRLTVPQRIDIIKAAKLCFNCLRSHRVRDCRFDGCTICHRRHNTLLHLERSSVKLPVKGGDGKSVSSQSKGEPSS